MLSASMNMQSPASDSEALETILLAEGRTFFPLFDMIGMVDLRLAGESILISSSSA